MIYEGGLEKCPAREKETTLMNNSVANSSTNSN